MAVVTLPLQSYLGWKVSLSVLHVVAVTSTIYRLVHRFRIHKTWWDDYVVFVPLVLDVVYWILFCVRFSHRNNSSRIQIILSSYWLSLFPYMIIVWSTRISLSLSLARIFPWNHPARRWSFILVVLMVLSCIACVLMSTLSCKQPSALIILTGPRQCIRGVGGFPIQNIFVFANDSISDLLLVISPLVFFWRLRLPRQERRLILMVFCASSLTLMFAIAFATVALNTKISLGDDFFLVMQGLLHIEGTISMLVCNLAVVSTCFYQLLSRRRNQRRREIECTSEQDSTEPCTCLSDQPPTPCTLTELSSFSSRPPSENSYDRSLRSTFWRDHTSRSLPLGRATEP